MKWSHSGWPRAFYVSIVSSFFLHIHPCVLATYELNRGCVDSRVGFSHGHMPGSLLSLLLGFTRLLLFNSLRPPATHVSRFGVPSVLE